MARVVFRKKSTVKWVSLRFGVCVVMNAHVMVCANQLFHITSVVESVALRLKVTMLS